jgi:alpha-tubulin suppressor-like RCC1 family protein
VPTAVLRVTGKPLPGVQSVSGGLFHVLALDADGCVHSWGDNWSRQLGARSGTLFRNLAGSVDTTDGPALCGAKAIAGGRGNTSYAIDATGRLLGWGTNDDGRLGDGTTESRLVPVPVLVPGTMF